MRDDPFTKSFKELQDALRCDDIHYEKFCYKSYPNAQASEHIHLSAQDLHTWTSAIKNGTATLCNPPRTQEFNKILNSTQQRHRNAVSKTPESASSGLPNVHIHLPDHSRYETPRFGTPRTPVNRHRPTASETFSSPLVAHESFVNGDGLRTFITWCEREYKIKSDNGAFEQAYAMLHEKEVNVDIMDNKTADWFQKLGITCGTAERMAKSFPKWKKSLLNNL